MIEMSDEALAYSEVKAAFGVQSGPNEHRAVLEKLYAVASLIEAVDQLLNDMGPNGLCVCNAAKAQARIAFEPFRDPTLTQDYDEFYMTLADARRVIAEASY